MKKLVIVLLVTLIAFSGCSQMFGTASSSVSITDTYKSGNYVYIFYQITNTGDYGIDYYKVFFDVTTSNGTTTEWDNGLYVNIGTTVNDSTMVYIGAADLISVIVKSKETM